MSDGISEWLNEFHNLNGDKQSTGDPKVKTPAATVPLNDELRAMATKDRNFFRNLTPEQQKVISPWTLARFASCNGTSVYHLMMVNEICNKNSGMLTKHKELQWLLLTVVGDGKRDYQWIGVMKGANSTAKTKLEQAVLSVYPDLSDDEVELFLEVTSIETLTQLLKDFGHDDTTIKGFIDDGTTKTKKKPRSKSTEI